MALQKANKGEIPKDAVILTEAQAFEYQYKRIEKWKNGGDVWPIKYGPGILGSMGAVTGIFINNHYRTKLRLGKYGQVTSYLPIVALPAIMTALLHKTIIQPKIFLTMEETCGVCIQTRAAAVQSVIGIGYPALLAPLASYMFAIRHFTFRLPSIVEKPLELFKVYRKMSRPITLHLSILLGVHVIGAMYLTHLEMLSILKIQQKIVDEHELDEELLTDRNS